MSEKRKGDDCLYEAQAREAMCAIKRGDRRAKTTVAYYKLTGCGGVEVDAEGAVVLLKERAKEGDSEAEWMLGLCYEYGIGIKQDIEQAQVLFRQSSDAGNSAGEILVRKRSGQAEEVMKIRGRL